jgi:hypothetical protein
MSLPEPFIPKMMMSLRRSFLRVHTTIFTKWSRIFIMYGTTTTYNWDHSYWRIAFVTCAGNEDSSHVRIKVMR